jgi:hypothetical protein
MDQENQKVEKAGASENTVNSQVTIQKRTLIIFAAIGLLLLIGIWVWKSIEINQINKQAEKNQVDLKHEASAQLMQTHKSHLILLAKPFVWALRTELLNKNLNQANLYLNDMVKEKGMLRIIIADPKGKIIASTNKKDEGQPFTSIENHARLTADETIVEQGKDSTLVLTSPVMGFNNRLGTLLIKYSAPNPWSK